MDNGQKRSKATVLNIEDIKMNFQDPSNLGESLILRR